MENKKTAVKNFVKKYSKKKRAWALLIIVVVFLVYLFKPTSTTQTIVTDTARVIDLKQTVLATGQVTSNTDLSLSFNSSGIVKSLRVKVGDKVKKGDVLATIDQGSQLAALTQARGALLAAQAKYKKIIEGGDVALAQVVLDQTKSTQETLVKNAYSKLLNSTPQALPLKGTNDYAAPVITGTYHLNKEGTINVKTYLSTNGGSGFNLSGLVVGSGTVATTTPQPLGNSGLYITFPSTVDANVSEWVITIPNTKAPDYLTNYSAYKASLAQSESEITQRTAELAVKKAQAGGSDIDLANAEIVSAQGQVQAAVSKFEDTQLRAPADGTITSIDIKLGELSEVQKPIITLQDISNLYIEAKINESSIANVKLGQKVSMTFDAFGSSKVFNGSVVHVDPSAITSDGIVNYKVKSSIDNLDPSIRTGMNADISILTAEKDGVVVIPKAALVFNDGKIFANVITDKDDKKYAPQEVTIGLTGDGNLIEITSGLSDGQVIAIVSK